MNYNKLDAVAEINMVTGLLRLSIIKFYLKQQFEAGNCSQFLEPPELASKNIMDQKYGVVLDNDMWVYMYHSGLVDIKLVLFTLHLVSLLNIRNCT